LREIDGQRFITDPSPGDKLVVSSADELWEKKWDNVNNKFIISQSDYAQLQNIEKLKGKCLDKRKINMKAKQQQAKLLFYEFFRFVFINMFL
jgi:hypothetical protein